MKTNFRNKTIAGVLTLVAFGAVSASAMGFGGGFGFGMNQATPDEIATRQTTMFQQHANLLGVSLDEVKQAWADGKSFRTLATEKGVTDAQLQAKLKTQREANIQSMLSSLVSKGVITQAQADKRLTFMLSNQGNNKNGEKFGRHGGHGMMHDDGDND